MELPEVVIQFDEYIKSSTWKCGSSPIGAHCWIGQGDRNTKSETFRCKYCGEVRPIPMPDRDLVDRLLDTENHCHNRRDCS